MAFSSDPHSRTPEKGNLEGRPGGWSLQTTTQLDLLVHSFERQKISKERWGHDAKLAILAFFLFEESQEEAARRVITGIRALKHVHGIPATSPEAYHETRTLFWLLVGTRFLEQQEPGINALDAVNRFVFLYGGWEDLIYEFFSPETLRGWRARVGWVTPDREPIERLGDLKRFQSAMRIPLE